MWPILRYDPSKSQRDWGGLSGKQVSEVWFKTCVQNRNADHKTTGTDNWLPLPPPHNTVIRDPQQSLVKSLPEHYLLPEEQSSVQKNPQKMLVCCTYGGPLAHRAWLMPFGLCGALPTPVHKTMILV